MSEPHTNQKMVCTSVTYTAIVNKNTICQSVIYNDGVVGKGTYERHVNWSITLRRTGTSNHMCCQMMTNEEGGEERKGERV